MNKLTVDDINADWIKYVVNPITGKTARESELEIHDKLAREKGWAVGNLSMVSPQEGRKDKAMSEVSDMLDELIVIYKNAPGRHDQRTHAPVQKGAVEEGKKDVVDEGKGAAVTTFLVEVEKFERTGSANSRSRAFAQRARQAVVNAYETVFDDEYHKTGEYRVRKVSAEVLATADKLVAMGATEAVYGRGRALLH